MKNYIGTFFVSLVCFVLSSPAQAGGFTVTYAFEAGDSIETGVMESCQTDRACEIKSNSLGLSIRLYSKPYLSIYLYGNGRRGCCYFANAENSVSFKEKVPPRNFPIFEGRKRQGLEIIYNHQIGILSLVVSESH